MGATISLRHIDDETLIRLLQEEYRKDAERVDRIFAARYSGDRGSRVVLEKKLHQRPRSSSESGAERGKQTFEDIYTERGEGWAREQRTGPAPGTSGRVLTYSAEEGTETDLRDQILDEINRFRRSPCKYAKDIEAIIPRFDGNVYRRGDGSVDVITKEGSIAVEECVQHLKNQQPLPELKANPYLGRAAERHAFDIGSHGLTGHSGTEALSFGQRHAKDIVIQLLVDDGLPDRGHRNSLLNEGFRAVGISVAPHKYQDSCCVIVLASDCRQKVEKLSCERTIVLESGQGATPEAMEILNSTPFDDIKDEILSALSRGEGQTVKLEYRPGEIVATIYNPDGSATTASGSWEVA